MMDKATRTKVRAHLKALEGMRAVLETNAKVNSSVVGPGIPEQIADEMKRLNGDVPSLGRPLDLRPFISHNVGRGDYYKLGALQAFVASIIGALEAMLEEEDETQANPVVQVREFPYVQDPDLRKILKRDYQEIQRAYVANCWKSVIILAGGAIEALLLDALSADAGKATAAPSAPNKKDLNKWDLADLIKVAVEIGVVPNGVDKLSHSIREYRNLVHPGNELRQKLAFGHEEARIAVEVLNMVDRELTP